MLGIMRAFFMPRAGPEDASLEEGRASREGRVSREKGRLDLEKERSWACRGEDASTIGRGSTTIRSEGPHAATLSPPAMLRKTGLAASQRQEHAEERAVTRKHPSRNAWLHPRPRADKARRSESTDAQTTKPRLGASLTKLHRSSSLTKLRRTVSLDKPQRSASLNLPQRKGAREPLRVDTITISRPQPLQPGTSVATAWLGSR